jgi:hypothetical protein
MDHGSFIYAIGEIKSGRAPHLLIKTSFNQQLLDSLFELCEMTHQFRPQVIQ